MTTETYRPSLHWLPAAATAFTVATTLLLTLSVAYNLGYFHGLGLPPGLVPLSVADYMQSVLLWLPLACAVAVCSLFMVGTREYREPSPLLSARPVPKPVVRALAPWKVFGVLGAVVLVLTVVSLVFRPMQSLGLTGILMAVWVAAFLRGMLVTPLRRVPERVFAVIYAVPIPLILVFMLGHSRGGEDMQPARTRYTATVHYREGLAPDAKAAVLRSFDKAFLIATQGGELKVVMAAEVRQITYTQPKDDRTLGVLLLCHWFDVLCGPQVPAQPQAGAPAAP